MTKKILIINSYFSPAGGAEVIAYNTFRMLNVNGFQAYFWSTNKKPYFDDDYKYKSYFTNLYMGIKDYLKNPIRYYYNFEAKKDLTRLLNVIKPDLIHIHGVHNLSASILDCCKDIPTIMTIHDAGIICPSGELLFKTERFCNEQYCKKGNFLPCIKNKCVRNNFENSLRVSMQKYMYYKKLKYVDKFITPSEALRVQVLKADLGIDKDNIVAINNFLDHKQLNYVPAYTNSGYFLYVGRLSKEKGIHYLLQAIKDLPSDIKFHLVGSGPEEKFLKNYADKNKMDNVEFLGYKNSAEIKEEYQNCIATILPCNWFENFPTTNMESFINGKPVIASNIGGIPEQVEHDETGLLFEPGNVEQLENCILKYWYNRKLAVTHGEKAYKKAKKKYTSDRYFDELMQVYNEVLK